MNQRQQSTTTYPLLFLLLDETDGVTGLTGASPTVTLSKNGGAFAAAAGAVSEVGLGWYALAGNATDRDTLGPLLLHAEAAGALDADLAAEVVGFDPFTNSLSTAERDAIANAHLDLADGIEIGVTPRQAQRGMAAMLLGDTEDAGTSTEVFRAAGNPATTRVTASPVDSRGNRTMDLNL